MLLLSNRRSLSQALKKLIQDLLKEKEQDLQIIKNKLLDQLKIRIKS